MKSTQLHVPLFESFRDKPSRASLSGRPTCRGTTVKGAPCKKTVKHGTHCYLHAEQARGGLFG
jgi:hypothetical protein